MTPADKAVDLDALIAAAENMDWQQVVLNSQYGPPCFSFEAERGKFCGRAKTWAGHGKGHEYISLAALLSAARRATEPGQGRADVNSCINKLNLLATRAWVEYAEDSATLADAAYLLGRESSRRASPVPPAAGGAVGCGCECESCKTCWNKRLGGVTPLSAKPAPVPAGEVGRLVDKAHRLVSCIPRFASLSDESISTFYQVIAGLSAEHARANEAEAKYSELVKSLRATAEGAAHYMNKYFEIKNRTDCGGEGFYDHTIRSEAAEQRVAELETMYRDVKKIADESSEWVFQRAAAESRVATLESSLRESQEALAEARKMPECVANMITSLNYNCKVGQECKRCNEQIKAVNHYYAAPTAPREEGRSVDDIRSVCPKTIEGEIK